MRDDQEQRETAETIETPFSTAAEEDAQRFNKPGTTGAVQGEPAVPEAQPTAATSDVPKQRLRSGARSEVATPVPPAKAAVPEAAPVNQAKTIIAEASQLPGVKACSVSFADGLSLAGNLPDEYRSRWPLRDRPSPAAHRKSRARTPTSAASMP